MLETILKTLAYADIFDYPLTDLEVQKFLIGNTEVEIKVVQKTLLIFADSERLPAGKAGICTDGGFYFLKGREEIIKVRREREGWSKEKWIIAVNVANKLKIIPSIKMIGISGALAMNNCKKDDDIDLIIIASKNSLWLTRLLLVFLCPLLGIQRRKRGEKKIKNKVCFNLFLEENHLKIEPKNLFLAHEIAQIKPIFDRNNTYNRFIKENEWVRRYLPNATKITNHQPLTTNNNKGLLSFFNILAFRMQFWYMKPKMTVEKVSLHQAFFHPNNLSDKIQEEFKRRVKSLVF